MVIDNSARESGFANFEPGTVGQRMSDPQVPLLKKINSADWFAMEFISTSI